MVSDIIINFTMQMYKAISEFGHLTISLARFAKAAKPPSFLFSLRLCVFA